MNRSVTWAAIVFGLSSTIALADISPTQFYGLGIRPIHAPGIRMVSAKVDIEWGLPSRLSAVFLLDNQSPNRVDVQLGFPLSLPFNLLSKDSLDFAMSFDGVPEKPSDITQVGKPTNNFPTDTTWYRCRHTFAPGPTTVKVTSKLPATLVYRTPYREILNYCVETGASWEGTIGSEEITIHFPSPVTPDQIIRATPSAYTIQGNTVHWDLKEFKPNGKDHDINLEYLRPDVAEVLSHLRAQVTKDSTNASLILQLARNLFALDRFGSNRQRYGDEARVLVKHLLEANPRNASAWNIYFARDSRYTPDLDILDQSFRREIQTAHEECPDDPAIQLWYERSNLSGASGTQASDAISQIDQKLNQQLRKQGIYAVDYQNTNYGYW